MSDPCTKHPNCLEPCVFCRVARLERMVESFQQQYTTSVMEAIGLIEWLETHVLHAAIRDDLHGHFVDLGIQVAGRPLTVVSRSIRAAVQVAKEQGAEEIHGR